MARNPGVFFLAGVILFSQSLFLHAAKYVLDYALAMTVVGSAVAGIGVGAFLAGRLVRFENRLFGSTSCSFKRSRSRCVST